MVKTSTGLGTGIQVPQKVEPQNSVENLQHVSPQNRDGVEKSALDGKREYPTGITRALILGPVTLTYFLFFLDLAVLSTATPAITSQFNSLVDVGWYGSQEISINLVLLTVAFQVRRGVSARQRSISALNRQDIPLLFYKGKSISSMSIVTHICIHGSA